MASSGDLLLVSVDHGCCELDRTEGTAITPTGHCFLWYRIIV